MKALSIWQPWATLIAMGLKHYETRSWYTQYRGPLLICASQHRLTNRDLMKLRQEIDFPSYSQLPFGKALCIVDLVEVYPVNWVKDMIGLSNNEKALGDFSYGRFV